MVISALTLTEVLAAIWGKVARGELSEEQAAVLDRAFMADVRADRFSVVDLTAAVVARSMACVRRHRLRAADALQLGTALVVRDVDPAAATLAAFDRLLRGAAAAEGLALLPPT